MERKTVGSLPGYAYAAGAGSPLFSVVGAAGIRRGKLDPAEGAGAWGPADV